jgi:hypothetical protein
MRNTTLAAFESRPAAPLLVWVVIILGVALRLLAPLRGHNYDVDSYRIVADIVAAGGNVYNGTTRYNYGPIWFHILHGLDLLPWFGDGNALRWKVATFLTVVDVGLFVFLLRRYSLAVAALFFLNPISIIITGYHSQFDNVAVLLGLLAAASYGDARGRGVRALALVGLGLSLSVKHILFMFPFWLAFKERGWRAKSAVILIPYLVFLGGFLFYLPGIEGIAKNVFGYRSFDNAPLWSIFLPDAVLSVVPKFLLFAGALFVLGFYWRKKSALDSLHFYLISLVVFSSALANQYLAICTPSIAVLWNWGYALYTVAATAFLVVEKSGLHLFIDWNAGFGNYKPLIFLLAVGLFISAGGQGLITRAYTRVLWVVRRLRERSRTQVKPRE